MVLYGPQGNSLGLLYALANKFAVFSQVYSTTGKQVSPPSSPSAALANFLYQPTLCLMQNFSPITYPSKGIRWLLCECELVTIPARTRTIKALNSKSLSENDPANLRLYDAFYIRKCKPTLNSREKCNEFADLLF